MSGAERKRYDEKVMDEVDINCCYSTGTNCWRPHHNQRVLQNEQRIHDNVGCCGCACLLWRYHRLCRSCRGHIRFHILEYYFLQLCGYEGSNLRALVLENPENRSKFIKQVEGEQPDRTDYQLASSLLAYINNPNGISDGLNYVEDCEDAEAYKRVFQMIFDALGQSQHYKMMTGQRTKS